MPISDTVKSASPAAAIPLQRCNALTIHASSVICLPRRPLAKAFGVASCRAGLSRRSFPDAPELQRRQPCRLQFRFNDVTLYRFPSSCPLPRSFSGHVARPCRSIHDSRISIHEVRPSAFSPITSHLSRFTVFRPPWLAEPVDGLLLNF
jgi:hypothetical protein